MRQVTHWQKFLPRLPDAAQAALDMGAPSEDDPQGLVFTSRLMDVLRMEREARGWTAVKLGEQAKVHRSVINRAENGERFPSIPVLVRLCRGLELPLSELCRRAEEDQKIR